MFGARKKSLPSSLIKRNVQKAGHMNDLQLIFDTLKRWLRFVQRVRKLMLQLQFPLEWIEKLESDVMISYLSLGSRVIEAYLFSWLSNFGENLVS